MVISLTKFQRKVYDFVKTIPKGETVTYKDVAVAIGHPKAYRAVGNALNKNPFAPIVPCHRVIKSDGSIGGFAVIRPLLRFAGCFWGSKKVKITTRRESLKVYKVIKFIKYFRNFKDLLLYN